MIDEIRDIIMPSAPLYSNLANISAILSKIPDINWAGFYIAKGDTLWLGPFQGDPACIMIPFGKGVCGSAARDKITYLVPDVSLFPGHIACSAVSRSEIVVPIIKNGETAAVIDIDSPLLSRFGDDIKAELEAAAAIIAELF